MVDIWWGIVEREGPGISDWEAYGELIVLVAEIGLKLQAVMSFHQCGGNIGDACFIALPHWVLQVGDENPDIFYTDSALRRNREYLSLGVDEEPLFQNRSALDMYEDFMASFVANFSKYMPDVITEAQVGMGPAGELRYPSYPLSLWQWPGIGEFQCYDKYLRKDLVEAATKAKKPEYGLMYPPHYDRVGNYNHSSQDTAFFKSDGEWDTPEGEFFLKWYSDGLIKHGDRVLTRAQKAFENTGIHLAAKVAGIHWHYNSSSHAPELTAGYYNTAKRNGYKDIAAMFGSHKALFDFTCLEMRNRELPSWASSCPQELVERTMRAAHQVRC
jgi:beta-amylase